MVDHADYWQHQRDHKFGQQVPPGTWPRGVKPISMQGLALLGIDERTSELHWDGNKLVTERRLATIERWLAGLGVTAALLGACAAVVQAWAAVQLLPH